MKNRILILLLSCYLIPFTSIGQNSYERQIKYWYLRDRLRHFIVPSDDPLNERGTYLVMTSRNRNWEDKDTFALKADYGQEMSMYSKYIGVLATEYYLLKQWGRFEEADLTNDELILALKAYKRLDLCEDYLNPPLPFPIFDGFFIRHDVPNPGSPTTPSQFLANSEVNIDAGLLLQDDPLYDVNGELREVIYIAGDMTPYEEKMSQDEAIFLLEGLALVYKFGSSEAKMIAKDYALLVLNRLYGYVSPALHFFDWWLRDHYGIPIPSDEGGCCQLLSFGYAKVAQDFFGFPGFLFYPGAEIIWANLGLWGTGGSDGHMVAALAAIGRGWGNETQSGIYKNTDQDGWDYYYLWLYKALWDESYSYYNVDRIEDRLDEGSCVGPWTQSFIIHELHGWAAPDRWRYNIGNQCVDEVGGIGIYSGLDYMILLNLYYICNGDGLSRYRNRITTLLDQEWPQGSLGSISSPYSIEAFRKVISKDRLLNSPLAADIKYQAGESILLQPGFKVNHGAHFIAKPQKLDYCSVLPVNHGSCIATDATAKRENEIQYKSNFINYELKNEETNSLNNEVNNNIIVFPIPSNGILYVKNANTYKKYEIYSSINRKLLEGSINENNISIDLSSLRAGVYLLILKSENKIYSRKISIVN